MRPVFTIALSAFAATLVGCASKKTFHQTAITSSQSDVASIRVNWVKEKGNKFDLEMAITNETAQPIIIFLADIRCARGNSGGELKHTFFNTGERTIDFHPRQSKVFRMVCRTGRNDGDYQLEIARVFSNPSGDGKNADKVIGHSIGWSGPSR